MSKAAMWAALEALADGDVSYAVAILSSAVKDEEQPGTANPSVLLRPAGGWPGEQPWWKS